MFGKKAQTKSKRLWLGASLGVVGLIIATVGSATGQVWVMRSGLIVLTIGGWIISWG